MEVAYRMQHNYMQSMYDNTLEGLSALTCGQEHTEAQRLAYGKRVPPKASPFATAHSQAPQKGPLPGAEASFSQWVPSQWVPNAAQLSAYPRSKSYACASINMEDAWLFASSSVEDATGSSLRSNTSTTPMGIRRAQSTQAHAGEQIAHGSSDALRLLRLGSSDVSGALAAASADDVLNPGTNGSSSHGSLQEEASQTYNRQHSQRSGTSVPMSCSHASTEQREVRSQPSPQLLSCMLQSQASQEQIGLERTRSLAEKMQVLDACSPTSVTSFQGSQCEDLWNEANAINYEGRVHKGLPRISSTPAKLYSQHKGSYGTDLWKLALHQTHSLRSQGSFEFGVPEADHEGSDE